MDKTYVETPYNFAEIEKYVILDKKKVADMILVADICFIYDTCAIRNHAKISDITTLISYIKSKNGVVIITRTVLMEMCSNDYRIWREHIDFIKKLSGADINVLIFNEEDSLQCLKRVYSDSAEDFNNFLKYALRTARKWKGTVDEIIVNSGSDMARKLCGSDNYSKTELFSTFFQMARASKKSEDNLAEELFMVCIAILSNIPDRNEYKYIIISEDRGSIRKLVEMAENLEKHTGAKRCSLLTTPALCQILIKEGLIDTIAKLQNVLDCTYQDRNIKVFCSEEYDLKPKEKDFTKGELADKLLNDTNFIVYY
jgi:hypothetical protein